jgi:uncharacterized membrane protein YkoI
MQPDSRRCPPTWRVSQSVAKVILLMLCAAAAAIASEKKIPRSALPPAVERTVRLQTQGAIIKGFTMETEHGKVEYEVETTVNGHSRDVSIAPDGTVLEVEEAVTMDNLPPAAKSALLAHAKGAQIGKIESITKNGKIVAYEAHVVNAGKRSEILIGSNGEKVSDED